MRSRLGCQRRVYRLATLLTGDPVAAMQVIRAVVDAQPDPQRLDSAHMDRLTVLRSREIAPATIADDRLPLRIAVALAALPEQQREAWVLGRVYRLPKREVSRAMDCSSAATMAHLEHAEVVMKQSLGMEAESAAQSVRDFSLAIDVPEIYTARQRRRRMIRHLALAVLILLAVAIAAVALQLILSRS